MKKAGVKSFTAAGALLLMGFAAEPGMVIFVGTAQEIQIAAEAARRCGIENFQIAPRGRDTVLLMRRASPMSGARRCLFRWYRDYAPGDLGINARALARPKATS